MSGDVWFAKHADFLSDPAIVELGDRHGPGGPLAIDALLGLAKLERKGGVVTVGCTALARRAFLTGSDQARAILRDSAEFGVIEIVEETALQATVRFPKWGKWQDAFRLQRHRDRGPQGSTDEPGEAGAILRDSADSVDNTTVASALQTVAPPLQERCVPVARRPLTEDRVSSSLRSELVAPPRDATAGLFVYWQQKCGHLQARLTADRRRKIAARLNEGYTVEQVRQAIDGAAAGAVVSDDGRRRYDDIELICRNGSKLESFIARATPATVRPVSVLQQIDRLNATSGAES